MSKKNTTKQIEVVRGIVAQVATGVIVVTPIPEKLKLKTLADVAKVVGKMKAHDFGKITRAKVLTEIVTTVRTTQIISK